MNCIYLRRKGTGDKYLDYCKLWEDAGHNGCCEGQCETCEDKDGKD